MDRQKRAENFLQVLATQVAIPHPNHPKSVGLEHSRAGTVIRRAQRIIVWGAIQLEHQPALGTIEIDDEAAEYMLPSELETQDLPASQQ